MEPNRFDQEFKEKLEKRVIRPSKEAWNMLSERLDDNQDKKESNKGYWLLGLAASLIGVLLMVTQFDSGVKDIKEGAPKVVIALDNDLDDGNAEVEKQNNTLKNDNTEGVVVVNEEIKKPNTNLGIVKNAKEKNTRLKKEKQLSNEMLHSEELTFQEHKIQYIVAQVQALKTKNNVVTKADIDALLVEAQKEIALNRLYKQTTSSVDAMALLESVEEELDQSFRDKVFEAIKTSYNSVKTAVAQRNE